MSQFWEKCVTDRTDWLTDWHDFIGPFELFKFGSKNEPILRKVADGSSDWRTQFHSERLPKNLTYLVQFGSGHRTLRRPMAGPDFRLGFLAFFDFSLPVSKTSSAGFIVAAYKTIWKKMKIEHLYKYFLREKFTQREIFAWDLI